jgi:hypothetical protein
MYCRPALQVRRYVFGENRIVNPAIVEIDPSMVDKTIVVLDLAVGIG